MAHALRSHFNFVEMALLARPERRAGYIGPILQGVIYGGAHTELGTPRPGEIRTRLTRQEDGGYRLDGRKSIRPAPCSQTGSSSRPAMTPAEPAALKSSLGVRVSRCWMIGMGWGSG